VPAELLPGGPLALRPSGLLGRALVAADPAGWTGVVLTEWQLTAQEWSDTHPFDELNYVLDGELEVECDGESVLARAGDLVRVPAGSTGTYRARYARMLAIYAHNPDGAATRTHGVRPLP
jgi:ethanolamine utilization protein EutQ (cupin superfamily)